eukprot:448263_1
MAQQTKINSHNKENQSATSTIESTIDELTTWSKSNTNSNENNNNHNNAAAFGSRVTTTKPTLFDRDGTLDCFWETHNVYQTHFAQQVALRKNKMHKQRMEHKQKQRMRKKLQQNKSGSNKQSQNKKSQKNEYMSKKNDKNMKYEQRIMQLQREI